MDEYKKCQTQAFRHGLLVMDVDATLIDEEVIDLLAQESGVAKEVEDITHKAMQGEIDFNTSLVKRVSMLKNTDSSILTKIREKIHVTYGAKELIEILHSYGWKIGAVSGGFHEVIDDILSSISIDFWAANHLEIVNGKLSGRVSGQIVNKDYKSYMLKKWAYENNISIENTVAIGDGANDIKMLTCAGTGIAFCAKEIVKNKIPNIIDKRDLREVLKFISKKI